MTLTIDDKARSAVAISGTRDRPKYFTTWEEACRYASENGTVFAKVREAAHIYAVKLRPTGAGTGVIVE